MNNTLILIALLTAVGVVIANDFDVRNNCAKYGKHNLLIWKTSITCTVNIEK